MHRKNEWLTMTGGVLAGVAISTSLCGCGVFFAKAESAPQKPKAPAVVNVERAPQKPNPPVVGIGIDITRSTKASTDTAKSHASALAYSGGVGTQLNARTISEESYGPENQVGMLSVEAMPLPCENPLDPGCHELAGAAIEAAEQKRAQQCEDFISQVKSLKPKPGTGSDIIGGFMALRDWLVNQPGERFMLLYTDLEDHGKAGRELPDLTSIHVLVILDQDSSKVSALKKHWTELCVQHHAASIEFYTAADLQSLLNRIYGPAPAA